MKKRNAMAIVCVVAMGVFVLSGCGIKDYVEQKVTEGITETVTETILEGSGLEDVDIDEVEWDDAIEYVDDLKSEFSTNPVDFSSEEDIMYQGTNEDGVILTVMVSGTTISVGVEKQ